jgi:hypothetical protein
MLTVSLLALAALTASPSERATLPNSPEGWRAAAAEDLTAIHDILRDNSPAMVVPRDSANFRVWLDQGLAKARAGLPKVTDFRGYYYILEAYVAGFRDPHIYVTPSGWSLNLTPVAWAGFMVGWRNNSYQVTYRSPNAPDAPPPGARLLSCDGKDAESVARTHDLYDGDLNLSAYRAFSAPLLFTDLGNPFITRPNSCVFSLRGAARAYQMTWTTPIGAQLVEGDHASIRRHARLGLGLQPWGGHGWWITVPSMTPDQDWDGFYSKIQAHLGDLRSAEAIVIDLRGNSGGDGGFGDRLARLIWGEETVEAHRPDLGPTVWRATRLNRDSWASDLPTDAGNGEYDAEQTADMKRVLALYDAALAHGDPTFTRKEDSPARPHTRDPDPVHGRIVILTDDSCVSACLDFLDEVLPLPRVIQAGGPTSADTIFMEVTSVPKLPSGIAQFAFPHKAWIRRPRGSNVPYAPSHDFTWSGDPEDEAGLRQWLGEALAKS